MQTVQRQGLRLANIQQVFVLVVCTVSTPIHLLLSSHSKGMLHSLYTKASHSAHKPLPPCVTTNGKSVRNTMLKIRKSPIANRRCGMSHTSSQVLCLCQRGESAQLHRPHYVLHPLFIECQSAFSPVNTQTQRM